MSRITITAAHALASVTHVPLGHLAEAVQARAARSERITALTLAAAGAALAAAGLVSDPAASPSPRIGVVLGTAFGCFLTNAAYQDRLADGGPPAASPRLFAATVSNAAAGGAAPGTPCRRWLLGRCDPHDGARPRGWRRDARASGRAG